MTLLNDPILRAVIRVRGTGAHLLGMKDRARNLRLGVTRRDEPDVGLLVDLVLNIAEARHRAFLDGSPDPYGLPPPDLASSTSTRDD